MNHHRPAAALLLLLCLTAPCLAAAPTIVMDGKLLPTPAPPVNRGGVILLPMRSVFQSLQANVRWLPAAHKIEARRGSDLVELWIGTPVAQVNRLPVQLLTPPLLLNNTTYVPLRFVTEAFGGTVRWDALSQTAFIYSPPAGQ